MDEFPCPDCDFVGRTRFSLVGHSNKHKAEARRAEAAGDHPPKENDTAEPAPVRPAEDAPRPRRPGLRERVRSWGRGRAGGPDAAAAPGRERAPRRPRSSGRRVPLDGDISEIWGALGEELEGTVHFPTGRMLQYQALGAGVILDKAVAGTLPDRFVLQPLARQKDRFEDAFLVVMPPMLTFAMTQTQMEMAQAHRDNDVDRYEAAERRLAFQSRAFAWTIRQMLPRLAAGIAKARERQEREAAVIAEAFPELVGTGVDPVEALRDMLFRAPAWDRPEEASTNGSGETVRGSGPDPSEASLAL